MRPRRPERACSRGRGGGRVGHGGLRIDGVYGLHRASGRAAHPTSVARYCTGRTSILFRLPGGGRRTAHRPRRCSHGQSTVSTPGRHALPGGPRRGVAAGGAGRRSSTASAAPGSRSAAPASSSRRPPASASRGSPARPWPRRSARARTSRGCRRRAAPRPCRSPRFADVLPADVRSDEPLELIRRGAAALRERGNGSPVVLGVDDAQLLDPMSAAVVLHLTVTGTAFVVATVRHGEPVEDAIVSLWKDAGALRLELAPLDEDATGAPGRGDRRRPARAGGPPLGVREQRRQRALRPRAAAGRARGRDSWSRCAGCGG